MSQIQLNVVNEAAEQEKAQKVLKELEDKLRNKKDGYTLLKDEG